MTVENGTMLPYGMRDEEYARLRELLAEVRPRATLEVGMAYGGSTQVICEFLRDAGSGKHTAIDPYQNSEKVSAGKGVKRIEQAGLAAYFELIEDFDYLAMPRLVEAKRTFDFILIDGWHSFDYTLVDFFYADLLLRPGGVLAIHDTGWPAVYKVCRFLETHKPYDRLCPPVSVRLPGLAARACRRVVQVLSGPHAYREARRRRTEWYSLAAYRKRADYQVADNFFARF